MSSEDAPEERSPPTSLLEAIKSGDPHAVQSFASEVSSSRLTEALTEECSGDEADGEDEPRSPLPMLPVFHAADGGNTKVFLAVYEAMKNNLERETVRGVDALQNCEELVWSAYSFQREDRQRACNCPSPYPFVYVDCTGTLYTMLYALKMFTGTSPFDY